MKRSEVDNTNQTSLREVREGVLVLHIPAAKTNHVYLSKDILNLDQMPDPQEEVHGSQSPQSWKLWREVDLIGSSGPVEGNKEDE